LHAIDHEARTGAQGYAWLEWSTRHIGHRLTGTANGAHAERSADSLFRASGLAEVAFFPFEAVAWQRRSVSVTVTGSEGPPVVLPSVALAMTPDSSHVSAELVDLGNGLASDVARLGERIRGRIALINLQLIGAVGSSENLHRSEKTALAIAHGAAGVLFVNHVDGRVLLTGTASVTSQPIAIPAACISGEDGNMLRERAARDPQLHVTINMRNSNAPVVARNIIATIPGTKYPDEVIVVGGHLDSWDLATGATDNGLGSFSVLDMARCFAALDLHPERTVRFVLFMGEEQGLLGSTALVNEWKRTGELAHVKCMINLDMSGDPRGFNVFGPAALRERVSDLQNWMHQQDTSFAANFTTGPGLHSDHQPFMLEGVPVIAPISDLGNHVYGCYHSSCDDIYLVDPQAMVGNVRRTGQLIWELSNGGELPGHFQSTELQQLLIAAGLEDKLRLQGDWRW
jgi:Iap family predicted aminopeptidase